MSPDRKNFYLLGSLVLFVAASLLLKHFLMPHQSPQTRIPTPIALKELTPTSPPETLNSALERLQRLSRPEDAKDLLEQWRRTLGGMPPAESSKTITDFLQKRKDAPTHLPFAVGQDGHLTSAPTLRVFLLDQFSRVDKEAAAAYAEQTLLKDFSYSADEWALALKAYAEGSSNPARNDLLASKSREMLRNEAWQKNPSVGYLESFDVAVYVGGTQLTPTLCELAQKKDNRAVAHAAFLALDRLVQAAPVQTLTLLQDQPELMTGREETRANFFARADMTDPKQKQVLEKYLLNPALKGQELQAFAGLYPNANYMVSYNLLTRVNTPDGGTLARIDASALRTIDEWLAEPRFDHVRPQLQTIRSRLQQFVKPGS